MDDELPPTHDRAPGLFGWLFGRGRTDSPGVVGPPAVLSTQGQAGPSRPRTTRVSGPRPRRGIGTSSVGWDADRQLLHAVITLAAGGVDDLTPHWRDVRRELDAEHVGRHLPPEAWNSHETVLTLVVPQDVDGDDLRGWIADVEADPVARISSTEVSLVPTAGRSRP